MSEPAYNLLTFLMRLYYWCCQKSRDFILFSECVNALERAVNLQIDLKLKHSVIFCEDEVCQKKLNFRFSVKAGFN